jgi:hypothetical protein
MVLVEGEGEGELDPLVVVEAEARQAKQAKRAKRAGQPEQARLWRIRLTHCTIRSQWRSRRFCY